MRSLSLSKSTQVSLIPPVAFTSFDPNPPAENVKITAVAIDLDQDALYVAAEKRDTEPDGEVLVQLWKIAVADANQTDEASSHVPTLVTTFATPIPVASNPWSSHLGRKAPLANGQTSTEPSAETEVLSLHVVSDTHSLALVTRAGDIATIELDIDAPTADVVGSVEAGILCAEWSPDDAFLVIVTGADKLILMTSSFDVLSEDSLHPTDFGEDSPTNVGWGAKHTQFHGSLGKAAAASSLAPTAVGASPDDDGRARVSWRGDGAFFVVGVLESGSTADSRARRVLRVYARDGTLQSTAEAIPGLEHSLSWRPSGNLIVGTQRFGHIPGASKGIDGLGQGREGRHDVVFFERNGLRHGEFELREQHGTGTGKRKWGYRVREVAWSADSNVLSVWIEGDDGDTVQLWTTGNYHWYLKQEIAAPSALDGSLGRFTAVRWHSEHALRIILTTSSDVIQRTYSWETFASPCTPPTDSGSVAVLDGTSLLLTPFRTQNVPPPMCAHVLSLSFPISSLKSPSTRTPVPVHASFSSVRDMLAVLWESGVVELFDLHTRLGPGRGKAMDPARIWAGIVGVNDAEIGASSRSYRQILVSQYPADGTKVDGGIARLIVLGSEASGDATDVVCVIDVRSWDVVERYEVEAPSRNGRLVPAEDRIFWQAGDGEIWEVDLDARSVTSRTRFPEFCFFSNHVLISDSKPADVDPPISASVFIGLSHSGKLYIATADVGARTLVTNANSFVVASGFLIFTTTAHVAQFAPLHTFVSLLISDVDASGPSAPEWETRRVERGSRIVTAVPSTMSLVLQMPRGNLETINPRPLVMEVVRQDIDNIRYAKAFAACRKHRIDLNVFVEHDRAAFMEHLPAFVEQVDDVDYINLFLTSLGQGPLPADVVAVLCDSMRIELEKKDLRKYINSILTAHVVKRPPDYEAGLALLLRLRDTEPHLVEDAVKYIIFLVDADKLFDTALGMYDFSLVLMVAQHAQKDPREYLPFLRELRALDHYYQRFKIDDHLGRYEKALTNLSLAEGSDRFEEAMAYVEKHRLYDHALSLWKDTDRYESVLSVYGEWLFERRDFREAAFIFRRAKKSSKAMVAHEKALEWQELFELALEEDTPEQELKDMAYRVAEDLSSKKRTSEAALVLLDYAKDVREAIIALVQGSHFSEARRIITLYRKPELLIEIVYPGALECRAQIAEDVGEMRDQLRKQVQRLRELRVRKVEEPDAFYGVEDTDLHNVDVMTDISMAPTTFTRYTVAPSNISRTSSKRSSRSKRKLERKIGSGRKGTVDEEEYLLKSVTKLVDRFNNTQADAAKLLPHLFQFTEEHYAEGLTLREDLSDFEAELSTAVEGIWQRPPEIESEAPPADSWAVRMQEHEKQRHINPVDKVTKPELAKQEWKLRLPERTDGDKRIEIS